MRLYLSAAVLVIGVFCADEPVTTLPEVTGFDLLDGPITILLPDVKGCIDLIIAFDTSCSISLEEQEYARNLTSQVIRALDKTATFGDGVSDIRVGVIRFQDEIKTVLSLEDGANADTIIDRIGRVKRVDGEDCHTLTFAALKEIQLEFTKLRPESKGASKVLFMVYDGITYSSTGFNMKPKTMVEINATKAAGVEVYVFQQHYETQTSGQYPDIELDALQHDDQHRFKTIDTNVRDVLLVMSKEKGYTNCGSEPPYCKQPPPSECTGLSVQSYIDPSKSWNHEMNVDAWTSDESFRFQKINLGLNLDASVDLPNETRVSFESTKEGNHFVHIDSDGKLSLARRPTDTADFEFHMAASFLEYENHWSDVTPKHTALESLVKRGHYIREVGGKLVLSKDDDTDAFKKSASFLYTILK